MRDRKLVATLGAVAGLILLWGVLWIVLPDNDIPFDRQTWLSYERYSSDTTRMRMCSSLFAYHLRNGMTKAQVVTLLGRPEYDYDTEWHYDIGPEWMNIDRTILCISFDKQSKVTAIVITQS